MPADRSPIRQENGTQEEGEHPQPPSAGESSQQQQQQQVQVEVDHHQPPLLEVACPRSPDEPLDEVSGEEIEMMLNCRRSKHLEMDNGNGPNERTALRPKLDTFDDALPHVGDFGRYQICLLLALLPFSVAYAVLYFCQFFFTIVPREHWCKVDELMDSLTAEQRIQAAIPETDKYPFYDTCQRKDLNFSTLLEQAANNPLAWAVNGTTNVTVPCDSWEYNFTQIPYASIGAELDWVCERSYLISTAQMIFYCGSIVGGFLFGWIADHQGRVPALVVCAGCGLLASLATATTSAFWAFALCRFFTGLAFDNIINIPLIIVVEYMAVSKRSLVVNVAFGVYFAIGSTVLPWAAYYIADWRYLCYVTALPLASCILTPWILPESARWYVSNRMSDKVIEKLKRIASINKAKPDPHFYETFYTAIAHECQPSGALILLKLRKMYCFHICAVSVCIVVMSFTRIDDAPFEMQSNLNSLENKVESATLIDLFKRPRLARTMIILIAFWSLTVVAFDGHVYSLKLLESSVFVSFSLACATELPAGLLLTLMLDRWGRRFCGFITMASTTAFSIAELLLESETAKLVMSVSSRFALNMAANVGLQYAAELLPTPVRAQGVGMIHIFGILAHSVAPYVVDTAQIWTNLPMLIISMVAFVCATLVLFLPETLGRAMPQTLQQGEDFGKEQKFWSLPCLDSHEDSRIARNNNRNGHGTKL